MACSTDARQAAVDRARTMPVVPRMEMPLTMPIRALKVRRASSSPFGTLMVTSQAGIGRFAAEDIRRRLADHA